MSDRALDQRAASQSDANRLVAPAVLALFAASDYAGGGVVTRQQNWASLRQGIVVWLDPDVETLTARLSSGDELCGPASYLADEV